MTKIEQATSYVESKISDTPEIGLVLGSGLGSLAEELFEWITIPYSDIPHFPVTTVEGHNGQLVFGVLSGRRVVAMQGRFHYYEGYSPQEVTFPLYVLRSLGIHTLIVTNAAGGLNPSFEAGDLMLITDHLNMTGTNPLIGPNDPSLGVRFPDMSQAYNPTMRQIALQVAKRFGFPLQQGVYAGISGPTYQTPAELIMLRRLGGDAVGMSTIQEVIAANHMGLKVLGITCITDMAIGENLQPLTHDEVVNVANRTRPRFMRMVSECIAAVPRS